MQEPTFKALSFNVSKELKSRTLMGEIRGIEIMKRLATLIAGLQPNEAIIVDATDSLIFDYEFSGHAFAQFFEGTADAPTARDLIFRISRSDRPAFFHGILKRLRKPPPKYAESQDAFAEAGLFCKLTDENRRSIEYIGRLSAEDRRVLAAIDESGSGNADEFHVSMHLPTEQLVDRLRSLAKSGFLLCIANGEPRYYSFSTFLAENV